MYEVSQEKNILVVVIVLESYLHMLINFFYRIITKTQHSFGKYKRYFFICTNKYKMLVTLWRGNVGWTHRKNNTGITKLYNKHWERERERK